MDWLFDDQQAKQQMVILAVAGFSVLIFLFMFIRAQGLRNQLAQLRRQISTNTSEISNMLRVVESLTFEQQITLRKRLSVAKNMGYAQPDMIKYTEAMTDAFVNVAAECAKGHKNTNEAFRKQLARSTDISFDDFNQFISCQSDQIKSEWHKKSIGSFYNVCDKLIDALNGAPCHNES
jgi:hypothetical protein